MLKMSTELRAGTSWYSSLFFILLYYKGKKVLFSVFLPCLINFSSYLCKQHLYCKPMYHSSVSKKYLLFLSLTLTPSKIRPNHRDSLPFENLAAKCSAPLLLGPSWEQVWWLHVFFRLWSTETRRFFLEDETLRMESEAKKKRMKEQLWWTLFPRRWHFFALKSVRRTWYHASWFWSLTLVLDSENLSCHSMSFSSCGMESLVCV